MTNNKSGIQNDVLKVGLGNIGRFNDGQLGDILAWYSLLNAFSEPEKYITSVCDRKGSYSKLMRAFTGDSSKYRQQIMKQEAPCSKRAFVIASDPSISDKKCDELLFNEHVVGCSWMISKLLKLKHQPGGFSINDVANLFHTFFKAVINTKEEKIVDASSDRKCILEGVEYSGLGLKEVPKDWDEKDVYCRIRQIPGYQLGIFKDGKFERII